MPTKQFNHFLLQIPLFSGLSPETLKIFTDAIKTRKCTRGEALFLHEEDASFFYIITRGWVKLFRETLDGDEAIVDILTTRHMFGETAIFEDGTYPYSAETVSDAEILILPTSTLEMAAQTDNKVALNLLKTMSFYRKQQSSEIEHLTVQNAPQRIGCFLLRLCDPEAQGSITLHLPYDKMLIASRLGMKKETFSRALSRLKTDAGIKVHGGTITINDMQVMADYCCSACSSSFPCADLKSTSP